jgi:hypothetical protein
MDLKDRLKRFDTHSPVSKEFRVYTVQGAVLSIVTLVFVGYLVTADFFFNFQVTLQEKVHVNASSPSGIELEFDVSLPDVPCSKLSIDANDPNGQKQSLHLDTDHHVWKHRITLLPNGHRQLLGEQSKLELGSTLLTEKDLEVKAEELQNAKDNSESRTEMTPCGDCYGAGEEGECCKSCEDVKRAYKRRGWSLRDTSGVSQCRRESGIAEAEGEGCNVHGVVALSSGGGNLHIAPGRDTEANFPGGMNIFDALLQSFHQWNVSHQIHKLRFGKDYPAGVYQLDGETRTITDGYGMYQYYFQVVPTRYTFLNGTTIQTHQYSVTEHLRHVSPGSNRGMPGIFFFYEVSPLHVDIMEVYQKGWIAFLTSVCAIVGGVVTIAGLIDHVIFSRQHSSRELMR